MPWTIPQLRLSHVVTITSRWQLATQSTHSLRSLGRIHAGWLRHYTPHVCARYWKVMCRRYSDI
ncbi:MAG: hypothetical protein CL599_12530 [Alteromonas sp.]|nr:hypothetical protein [Alteromonas sp.]